MKLVEARRMWTLLLVAAMVLPVARGVWFTLPSSGSKCISEDIRNSVVVIADYYSFYGDDDNNNHTLSPTLFVKVSSPFGNELYHKEKASYGQFAFTTTEAGNYLACFSMDSGDQTSKSVTVGLDWKIGFATKDWDSIAKKEKIEGLDLELKRLEGYVKSIHEKMISLMNRELEMRAVNEITNTRVAIYSIMSLAVCVVVSVIQLLYLRRYFRKKKLI